MSIVITSKKDGSVTTSFVGCVVKVETASTQVMSDIWEYLTYATAYNDDSGTFERHFIRGEYESADEKREAAVDATDEVKALYEAHLAVEEAKKTLESLERRRAQALAEVREPGRGKTLKVVRGRKIAIGTVGECTWYGRGRGYGFREGKMRVGIKVNGGVEYTDAHNVVVVVG